MKTGLIVAASLLAASVRAQVITTSKLDITLVSTPCALAPGEIHVVLQGDDREYFTIKQDPANRCHYAGEIPTGPITIRDTVISVRFGGARSDCRIANSKPDKDVPRGSVGTLTFKYEPHSARNLSVALPTPFSLHYVRYLSAKRDVSVECREVGLLSGSDTIADVAFKNELLTLQFRASEGESNAESVAIDQAILAQIQKAKPLTADTIGEAYKRQKFVDDRENPQNRVDEKRVLAEKLRKKGFTKALLKLQ